MSRFNKAKLEDDLVSLFKPVFEIVNGLSKYTSILIMVTKSSYNGSFYILDSKGKRITNTALEENDSIDGNTWDKAVEKTAKSLRKAEGAYDPDCLNVYTVTIDNGKINISIQYLDDTGHDHRDALKKWLLG